MTSGSSALTFDIAANPAPTRSSIITLDRDAGMSVTERPCSFAEWQEDARSGQLSEAFACATAAVGAPIGKGKFRAGGFPIGNGEGGPVTARLPGQLVGIQRGAEPDPHAWVHAIS